MSYDIDVADAYGDQWVSKSTIRGTVRYGTPQQGDGPTTSYYVLAYVSFFYALIEFA